MKQLKQHPQTPAFGVVKSKHNIKTTTFSHDKHKNIYTHFFEIKTIQDAKSFVRKIYHKRQKTQN